VHCLIHTYQLSRDVRRRHQIHTSTQSFARLLHEKSTHLTLKEKAQTHKINYPSILQDCRLEESRWERNWTTPLRGEYILDTLKTTLTPFPPTDFFSQSYEEAFGNYVPCVVTAPRSCIQSSSNSITTNITNLMDMEKDLHAQITRLETVLGPINPVITSSGGSGGLSPNVKTTPRKTSLRKSLPPTPITTPGSSPRRGGGGLEFTRSYSRLERRASESPLSARGLTSEHGILN
jgi:hypothetical protein